jgi:2'-5' RNA ligase
LDDFNTFWALYPKKVAKADARKAWLQTKDIRPELTNLLNAVKAACKTEAWMKDGGKYIPHPATWLRGERWDDELEVKLPNVVNEKPWHETATGIELKGKELGLDPSQFESFPHFKVAVMRAALKSA